MRSSLSNLGYQEKAWSGAGTVLEAEDLDVRASLVPVVGALDGLATLPQGWNSYRACPVAAAARNAALRFLVDLAWEGRAPSVSPTPSGGVQLEWGGDDNGVEFEFDRDGGLTALVDIDGHITEHRISGIADPHLLEAVTWAKKLA